jgi:cytosine/adenosine deaminase-related metal-dependent hydrolase
MILNNVKLLNNDIPVNIAIKGDKIGAVTESVITDASSLQLNFKNAFIFPGLINSHDHLDFNLFPQLGDRVYNNYTEWGKHLHQNYKDEIAQVLKIPVALRLRWGLFKNLLCGVTTVVNHGEPSGTDNALINAYEKAQSIHSVQFDKRWKLRLNNPLKHNLPVAIHVGEGTDRPAFNEINDLIQWNLLNRKLTGIHGVAMTQKQAEKFEALVWCPQSNYFLLNQTAPVEALSKSTDILFGTDSTLTGTWNIWEHLRIAQQTKKLSNQALYNTLNKNAAKTWQLNNGEIETGKNADLVVADADNNYEAFFTITPDKILLVICNGAIILFDESLLPQLQNIDLSDYDNISINGASKFVKGKPITLMEQILAYNPQISFPISTIKEVVI